MWSIEVPDIDFALSDTYLALHVQGVIPMPRRAHAYDAGIDLYCVEWANKEDPADEAFHNGWFLEPGKSLEIKSGLHVNIPPGWMGQVINRSSLLKQGLLIPNNAIDSGYTGEIQIVMFNATLFNLDVSAIVNRQVACAQLVITPCWCGSLTHVRSLPQTDRGQSGFGSTNKQ